MCGFDFRHPGSETIGHPFGAALGCRDLDTDTIYIVRHFVSGPTVMLDKKGRSGHKRGEISRTPTAFAGIHLRSYRLWWRLGVPFWVGPDKQLVEPSRPGVPVPATMDRMLAEMAIEHMVRVNWPGLRQRLRVTKVIDWANRHRSLI